MFKAFIGSCSFGFLTTSQTLGMSSKFFCLSFLLYSFAFKLTRPLRSVFQAPWNKVIAAIEASAYSHHLLAGRIENEVEGPLRAFQSKSESLNIQATSENLTTLARDLEESQKKVEAQTKKAGKANMQKLDAAQAKLESATQQWESQAPFIFESLQAFDEHRINQLRDLLTQYQTYETEKAQRSQATAAETLAAVLEISTELEIASFKERVVAGKPKLERKSTTPSRQGSSAPTPQEDTVSEHSTPAEHRQEPEPEPKHETKREEKKGK